MRCLNAVSVQFIDMCKFPVLALSPVEDVTLVVLKSDDITANIKMLINHTIESVILKAVRKQFWYFLAQISDATASFKAFVYVHCVVDITALQQNV